MKQFAISFTGYPIPLSNFLSNKSGVKKVNSYNKRTNETAAAEKLNVSAMQQASEYKGGQRQCSESWIVR